MKKSLVYIFFSLVLLVSAVPQVSFAQATIIYQPLAPINGFIDRTIVLGKEDSLAPYLNQIVRILIAAATGLAVIVIVYGAIQYTLTDSVTSKGEAKSTIMRAIYGLILALTSYLILNTLNPAMLSGKIRGLQEQKVAAVESGGGASIIAVNDGRINANSNPLGTNFEGPVGDTINQAANSGSGTADKIYRGAVAASNAQMNTCSAAGTNGGRVACVYAVDTIVANATGINVTDSLSTADLNKALASSQNFYYAGSDLKQTKKGDIVVSPTVGSNRGHTGIVSEDGGGGIISNSSSQGKVTENYTATTWQNYFEGKGLQTYIYRAAN